MELKASIQGLSGDTQKDLKAMHSYIFQLTEEMRYLMTNLDVTNFNDLGLARYENGRMQLYADKLEVKASELELNFLEADAELGRAMMGQITASASGLRAEFQEADNGLKTEFTAGLNGISSTVADLGKTVAGQGTSISNLSQTASQIQTTVTEHGTIIGILNTGLSSTQSIVTQTANSLSAIVTGVGANGTVTAASIVAAINSSGSRVQISADHIELFGVVTVEDLEGYGETVINGAYIKSGMIEGTMFRSNGPDYGDVYIENGCIEIGGTHLFDDTYGEFWVSGYDVNFELDGKLRIYVGTAGSYWEFRSSGIYWRDADGTRLASVVLE